MRCRFPKRLLSSVIVAALSAGFLAWGTLSGCDLVRQEIECSNSSCLDSPQVCVEVIPYTSDIPVCDQISIEYFWNGVVIPEQDCGRDGIPGDMSRQRNPTACSEFGNNDPFVEVTVTHGDQAATQRIELAEYNRCGEDIAYVYVTLHEDGPPTFGEVAYISPCMERSL